MLFCTLCLQSFSQTILPTDTAFYENALCDMVNVYDSLYPNYTFDDLYIEKSKDITNIFKKQDYNINNHKVILLNERQLNKAIKRKKHLGFKTFYPNIVDTGLMKIYVSFIGGIYKKHKVWQAITECASFRLVYKYDYECQKWVYMGYERCGKKIILVLL
jgi:hypothetical protein